MSLHKSLAFALSSMFVCGLNAAEVALDSSTANLGSATGGDTIKVAEGVATWGRGTENAAGIKFSGGILTLDLSEAALDQDTLFHINFGGSRGLRAEDNDSSFNVTGATAIKFGCDWANMSSNFPQLDTPVTFEGSVEGGTVHLVGYATLGDRFKGNLDFSQATRVAYWYDPLDGSSYTVSDYDRVFLTPLSSTATLTIPSGRTAVFYPAQHQSSNHNSAQAIAGTYSLPIVIEEGGTLDVKGDKGTRVTGALSGAGTIESTFSSREYPAVIAGDVTAFTGTYRATAENGTSYATIALTNESAATVPLMIELGTNNWFKLGAVGDGTTSMNGGAMTTATIASLTGIGTQSTLALARSLKTVSIDSISQAANIRSYSLPTARVEVVVGTIESGAYVRFYGRLDARINKLGSGVKVELFDYNVSGTRQSLTIADDAGALEELVVNDVIVAALNGGTINRISGAGRLEVTGPLTVRSVSRDIQLVVLDGGSVTYANDEEDSALNDLPALWLDASATETFDYYLENVASFTNGYKYLRRWNDRRATQTELFGLNPRGEGYVRCYPYVVTSGLNGRDYVSFGGNRFTLGNALYSQVNTSTGEATSSARAAETESRRLPFNKEIMVYDAIFVFGSQYGGGKTLLGGYAPSTAETKGFADATEQSLFSTDKTATAPLVRGGSSEAAWRNPETPILKSSIPSVQVDGSAVDATTTGLNGGWQILSFSVEEPIAVRSLGLEALTSSGHAVGGQNYAEILLYTNKLTHAQRRSVEIYLAQKWGVQHQSVGLKEVLTSPDVNAFLAGGLVRLGGTGNYSAVLDTTIAGYADGELTLSEGVKVTLADESFPYEEEDLPTDGLVARFDPEADEDIVLASVGDLVKVSGMYSRGSDHTTTNLMLYGYKGSRERRPNVVVGPRGTAPSRRWIDYTFEGGAKMGTDLRLTRNSLDMGASGNNGYNAAVGAEFKSVFIVSDSTRGGGTLLNSAKEDRKTFVERIDNGLDFASPIWPAGSAASVRENSSTWVNGVAVDGTTDGLSGAPEVVSATFENTIKAGFYGYYGGTSINRSYSILGEVLFYSDALSDEVRGGIESFLMKKWLARLPEGYSDFRQMTVKGAGVLSATHPAALPQFDPDFTGAVEITGADLTFTFDSVARCITEAVELNVPVSLPESGTIRITGALRSGRYPLITATSIDGINPKLWTVETEVGRKTRLQIIQNDEGSFSLSVMGSDGFMLIVR